MTTPKDEEKKRNWFRAMDKDGDGEISMAEQAWLPVGYSQIFRLSVFGPSGFWTMAPVRYAAKLDPFLSLDCAPPCPTQPTRRLGDKSS